ncbi:MAG: diguanylate cyclase, partial [Anaerolineales bacterium]|nr:diguanylate cyclase [Anaerolineales bacterium]
MNMKILIVEDEPIYRQMVKKYLHEAGYEIVEAEDGQSAWNLFQQEPFHLVITDWQMPGLNGPELIQNIRTSGQKTYTYIILLTAMDNKENVVLGLESGADEYLTKPFNSKELIARVASGMRILRLEEQLMQAHQQMEILAMHDGMTGLLNRRAIEEYAEAEFDMAVRNKRPLCVVLLDIDHFKSVNDRFGHKFGDHTLRQAAKILTEDLRSYDRVGRWGGEEFILVLPDTDLAFAAAVAERVRLRIAEMQISMDNGESFSINISLGVACTSAQFPSLTKLIDAADQALYQAKQAGRNRV